MAGNDKTLGTKSSENNPLFPEPTEFGDQPELTPAEPLKPPETPDPSLDSDDDPSETKTEEVENVEPEEPEKKEPFSASPVYDQTRYQNLLGVVRKHTTPAGYQAIKTEANIIAAGGGEPPAVETPAPDSGGDDETPIYDMPVGDFKKMIAETVNSTLGQHKKVETQAKMQETYAHVIDDCDKVLGEIVNSKDPKGQPVFTEAEISSVKESVARLNLDLENNPVHYASATEFMAEKLHLIAMNKNIGLSAAETEKKETDRVRNLNKTTQPTPGALPDQAGPTTEKMALIQRVKDLRPSSLSKLKGT